MHTSSYEISTDPSRLDFEVIFNFLRSSYWARNIPRSVLEKAITHSLCFGAYHDGLLVSFARVITDHSTFAYLADVFVLPEHRGKGVSKLMLRVILDHPELQGLRRFLLATHDAHGLYAQFGFQPLEHPERYMTMHNPDVYMQKSQSSS